MKKDEEISRKILKIKDNCPCSLSLLIESPPMAKKATACSLHMRYVGRKQGTQIFKIYQKLQIISHHIDLLNNLLIYCKISIPLAVCKSAI